MKTNKDTGVKKVHHYYHCTNGRKIHDSLKGLNLTEDKLWSQFEAAVDQITLTEQLAKEIADALKKAQDKARIAIKRQINGYRDAVEGLRKREDDAYGDFKNGVLDEHGYRRQITKLRDEQNHYMTLLEKANLAIHDASCETAQSILELATNAKTLWLSRSAVERREFLSKILSNPVLEGLSVRYELKKPFEVVAKMSGNEEWRTRKDSNLRPLDS